jgi:hypothetical protein
MYVVEIWLIGLNCREMGENVAQGVLERKLMLKRNMKCSGLSLHILAGEHTKNLHMWVDAHRMSTITLT